MLNVKKVTVQKESYLSLLELSGCTENELMKKLATCDLYVLFSGTHPISAALVQPTDTQCEIIAIATDEGHRGLGYGARLVEYLSDEYIRTATTLRLHIHKDHALPFYRLGFSCVKEEAAICLLEKNLKELD